MLHTVSHTSVWLAVQYNTRVCDLAVLHKSIHPLVFTRPSTQACPQLCDTSQYVCPISNGLRHGRVWSRVRHTAYSHRRVAPIWLKFF
ncbi:hypothetical protein F383_35426 [Gossypium arboreum]|uniref:Uncharacterized protein n=1 Tax=Gossypium arboreum TaxID=29729 RepID=A0A0B0NBX1_GOSAR|nr:hypothetical protein F383_35426 [Gossypium arboreum]